MPDVILKFDIPEEMEEFQSSIDGVKWKSIAHFLSEKLRAISRHADNEAYRELADLLIVELYNEIEEQKLDL